MAVIDELRQANNIQYNEEGLIKIKPLSQYEYQTYPIEEEHITITEDEYIGLKVRVYQFTEDLLATERFDPEKFKAFLFNLRRQ